MVIILTILSRLLSGILANVILVQHYPFVYPTINSVVHGECDGVQYNKAWQGTVSVELNTFSLFSILILHVHVHYHDVVLQP